MREQQAEYKFVRRASADVETSSHHRAGFSAGIHPEDIPSQSVYRKSAISAPTTNAPFDDELYQTPRTRSSIIKKRSYLPAPINRKRRQFHSLFYGGLATTCVLLGVTLSSIIPPLFQRWSDDRAYGYPRTYQVDQNAGHGGMSHFIALNYHGMIEVMETPEPDPSKFTPHTYMIAQLANGNADLYPVTISFHDLNNDGKIDMEVSVDNTVYVLFNDGSTFKQRL